VQLDGVNAGGVVAVAWAVSGLMAGLVGVLFAASPLNTILSFQPYISLMVAAIAAAAWGVLRSMPIAAGVAVLLGVVSLTAQGYLTPNSIWHSAVLTSLPFIVLVGALLFVPGLRSLEESKDPLASVDPPTPATAAASRSPQFDRIIRALWYVLLGAFVVSMLTWMPKTWENVFNSGLALSTIFLSITLITGMGGQLSLAQATLAGVGAFTAGQLASHLGLNYLVGGLIGAVVAAAVATVLAVGSLRLKGLGLTLMTLAGALLFDSAVFSQRSVSNGTGGLTLQSSWFGPFKLFDPSGHPFFILAMVVLVVLVIGVLLVRRGTFGLYLSAMRGSETGAGGVGINLSWQRVLVFALSGAVAGIGGTLLAIEQTRVAPEQFNYEYSLIFVVVVVTTGVSTVEGAIQGGMGFVVIEQLLTYAPSRFQGLTVALFAFGALTYARHPEGVLEYQKNRSTARFERLFLQSSPSALGAEGPGPPGPLMKTGGEGA
jgi:branched-chain amino acid transport system permease protein